MCTFVISYSDGNKISCEHIKSASYLKAGSQKNVPENELLTHCFPTNQTLHLHAENRNFSISHDGIRSIDVVTE